MARLVCSVYMCVMYRTDTYFEPLSMCAYIYMHVYIRMCGQACNMHCVCCVLVDNCGCLVAIYISA